VAFLSSVAAVGEAALAGGAAAAWRDLAWLDIAVQDLDRETVARYGQVLTGATGAVLTHGELLLVVDRVNSGLASNLGGVEVV
jgi:hypothetical protein